MTTTFTYPQGSSFATSTPPPPPNLAPGTSDKDAINALLSYSKAIFAWGNDLNNSIQQGWLIADARVISLSADKIVAGSIITNLLYIGGNNFVLDGTQTQLNIFDNQAIPQLRIQIGKLGAASTQWGIKTIDATGVTQFQSSDTTFLNGGIINSGSILGTALANATITGSKIASSTITNSNIVAGTITGASIANATITGSNIANTSITGAKISGGTITGANISASTITGSNIVSNRTQGVAANNINTNGVSSFAQSTFSSFSVTTSQTTVSQIGVGVNATTDSVLITSTGFFIAIVSSAANPILTLSLFRGNTLLTQTVLGGNLTANGSFWWSYSFAFQDTGVAGVVNYSIRDSINSLTNISTAQVSGVLQAMDLKA